MVPEVIKDVKHDGNCHVVSKSPLVQWAVFLLSVVLGSAILASSENLLEMQNHNSTPDLIDQNLHFDKIPQVCTTTSEKHYYNYGLPLFSPLSPGNGLTRG